MVEQSYLFLSYRSLERQFALRLAKDLKNEGIQVWMDVFEIQGGDDWVQRLQDALDSCSAVIAVVTPDYVSSKYCRRELKRADSLGHAIYPVLLQQLARKEDWPFEVQERQYVDFTQWRTPQIYRQRLQSLISDLGGRSSGGLRQRPDPEIQYLNALISDLEARRGTLEYVELHADMASQQWRPPPTQDEWGFGYLLDQEGVSKNIRLNDESLSKISRQRVLLGDPGAGKSTALRRLALVAARQRLDDGPTAPLPIVRYLQEWPEALTIQAFIRMGWPLESDPLEALASGTCRLFLDGLNEMGEGSHAKVAQLRSWLHSNEAPSDVTVTCRTQDYEHLGLDISEVTISPLTEEQFGHFADSYLGDAADNFFAAVRASDLYEGDQLPDLISNPYALSALIFVFHSTGRLGKNRFDLLARLVRALWERERLRNTEGWLPFEQGLAAVAKLAFQMIVDRQSTAVELAYVKGILGAELTGVALGAGILDSNDALVQFSHQSLQEYLAAERVLQIGWHEIDQDALYGNLAAWKYVLRALIQIADNPVAQLQAALNVSPYLVQQAAGAKNWENLFADCDLTPDLDQTVEDLRATYHAVSNLLWDEHHADIQFALEQAWDLEQQILPVLMDVARHIKRVDRSREGESVVRFAMERMKSSEAQAFCRSWQS